MRITKTAGFSLAEVLIALAILALASGAVVFLFFTGTKLDAAGYKLTIAQAEAQLRMEELIGLTREELAGHTEQRTMNNYNFPSNVEIAFDYQGFPVLAHAVVTVYDPDGGVLCELENILNVEPGGGFA